MTDALLAPLSSRRVRHRSRAGAATAVLSGGKMVLGLMLLLLPGAALAGWQVNMSPGVSEVSRGVYDLHMLILIICAVIGVLVFGVMFYSLYAHRRSRRPTAATFHESTTIEVIWTLVPFAILVGMAIPATRVLIDMEDTSRADVTIKVTGYQWKWHYDYIGEDVAFFSAMSTPRSQILNLEAKGEHYLLEVDKPVVVPVGQKVRLLVTAADVIHSWWMPAVAVKKDAIPGFINEAWFRIEETGTYRGQCTELCGRDHAYMPIVIEALAPQDYEAWLRQQRAPRLTDVSGEAAAGGT